MLAHIRGNQRHAHRENDEPAIIDSDGNAVDACDENLAFEETAEGHQSIAKGKSKKAKIYTLLSILTFPIPILDIDRYFFLFTFLLPSYVPVAFCHCTSYSGTGC